MSALAYDVTVQGKRRSTVTIWANSAEQAAKRVERQLGLRCVKVSDRNKKVDA